MTTIEYFARKYAEPETAKIMRRDINEAIKTDSAEYVKLAVQWFIGGAWSYKIEPAVTDLADMIAVKMIRIKEHTGWRDRARGNTKEYILTVKGARALYRYINA